MYQRLSNFKKLLVCALLCGVAQFSVAADFAVSPMMIDLEGVARSEHEFSFTVFGKADGNVKLELFDMSQLETGYMGFTQASLDDGDSMASWIELDETRFRIREGEETKIRGSVTVPPRAAGTYLVGVMVEEDIPEEEQSGIAIRVRYAVVLNMRVEGSVNRRIKTSFEELAVVEQEDGIYLQGVFENASAIDNWLESQVQIRGEDNRLIERVTLKTQSAWQRGDDGSRVFPGAKVTVFGKLENAIAGGDYQMLVRNRFAEKTQPVYRDTIRIEPSAELLAEAKQPEAQVEPDAAIELSPGRLDVEIKPNGTSLSPFMLTNNTSESIEVELPQLGEDLSEYGVSEYQFYPAKVLIPPGQKKQIVLKQSHLPEASAKELVFKAQVNSPTGGPLDPLSIPAVRGS
jgi:hypothetical protein